jgi:uncharacterized protein (TIGR00255 family)
MVQIQSMTGYGRGHNASFSVEVRSTNHKALDIQLSMPPSFYPYEGRIRRQIRERFQRGRIELRVTAREADFKRLRINRPLAREYYKELSSLMSELSIPGNIDIGLLSSMRDIFIFEETDNTKGFERVLATALDELKRSRIKEGSALVSDIKKRLRILKRHLRGIEARQKGFSDRAMRRMRKRLRELLKDVSIDESRIIQELAIMIERSDITEEIVRIKSHIEGIERLIATDDAVGKRIDFYAQELRREINTIGSKALDVRISNHVVEMKHEVEKIREQAQNLQ